MTNDEAIKYITQHCNPDYPNGKTEWETAINMAISALKEQPIRCKDCVYYDPPHIDDNGERREYKDMPAEAFDELGTGLVNMNYGINVGGRCLRDYNVSYSDDKRIFVPETNYCGRAERRKYDA